MAYKSGFYHNHSFHMSPGTTGCHLRCSAGRGGGSAGRSTGSRGGPAGCSTGASRCMPGALMMWWIWLCVAGCLSVWAHIQLRQGVLPVHSPTVCPAHKPCIGPAAVQSLHMPSAGCPACAGPGPGRGSCSRPGCRCQPGARGGGQSHGMAGIITVLSVAVTLQRC